MNTPDILKVITSHSVPYTSIRDRRCTLQVRRRLHWTKYICRDSKILHFATHPNASDDLFPMRFSYKPDPPEASSPQAS